MNLESEGEEKKTKSELEASAQEEEIIDVAEEIFIKIAEAIKNQEKSVREVFEDGFYQLEIEGEAKELITGDDFQTVIWDLGVNDLSETEIECILSVLIKPECYEAIDMSDFFQIMKNFGLEEHLQEEEAKVTVLATQQEQKEEEASVAQQEMNA